MEHSVVVHLKLSDSGYGSADEREAIWGLKDKVADAIARAEAGVFDGDEIGQGECVFFLLGPDADTLFSAVHPILKASRHARGGFATKRYGDGFDPRAQVVRVDL